MTIESMILSHDESALEALTSKGLLRRAKRVLGENQGQIETVDKDKAVVNVEGCRVELYAKGPASSSCTCKAHGVCRHMLHAILLLRNQGSAVAEPGIEAEASNSVTEICSLADEEVIKFSGTDWAKAAELAASELDVSFEDEGINITVRLAELNAAVTFISGNGLKGAAYKGPKTRKRLLTTLAALAVRQREGRGIPKESVPSNAVRVVSAEFIDQAQKTIERAVSAALPSRSVLARDLFLDLAISTRCEALPRLSAELRELATHAQLASERSVEFEPESFLMNAARAYALLEALRSNAADPQLVGAVRRDYQRSDEIEVWPLGVSRWRSRTGARGLTAYVWDSGIGRWLTVSEGRSAGVDTSFDVLQAYSMPVWGAGTLNGLMGRRVRLPEPSLSADGAISAKAQSRSELLTDPLSIDELTSIPAAHKNWTSLRTDLATRMGQGIRRRPVPVPAFIVPTGFGQIGFDDMTQTYHWELFDNSGDALVLNIHADDEDTALRIWKLGKKISAIVIEARLENHVRTVRPVSIVTRHRNSTSIHNIDFDAWALERGISRAISKVKESLAQPLAVSGSTDPVDQMIADVSEELVSIASGSTASKAEVVSRRLEACGLATMQGALNDAVAVSSTSSALRAAYLASELKVLVAHR